jgi:hypothetical protein
MHGDQQHWDRVYAARASSELGWYEPRPSTLRFVIEHSPPGGAVIDVGGGDSRLVDALLDLGDRDVTVLDLSGFALGRARGRLGDLADRVTWIVGDVTTFRPDRTWDLWHDRAVFHFLVDESDRAAYREVALAAVGEGGRMVVATFAPDGPERCAGLPVARYDAETLAAEFAPELRLVDSSRVTAGDPDGDRRPYVVVVLQRTA